MYYRMHGIISVRLDNNWIRNLIIFTLLSCQMKYGIFQFNKIKYNIKIYKE